MCVDVRCKVCADDSSAHRPQHPRLQVTPFWALFIVLEIRIIGRLPPNIEFDQRRKLEALAVKVWHARRHVC